jgi:hypothetical protein
LFDILSYRLSAEPDAEANTRARTLRATSITTPVSTTRSTTVVLAPVDPIAALHAANALEAT